MNRKTLREECWFVWHSFTRVGTGMYSTHVPWSPGAIEARRADPKARLVIEHVEPFTLFCERLEAIADGPIEAVEQLLRDIILVVITTEEDAMVTAAGFRNRLPQSNNSWDQYLPRRHHAGHDVAGVIMRSGAVVVTNPLARSSI